MIHYHGSPIGGQKHNAAKFWQGRHGLVSYEYKDDLPVMMDVCKTVVFDNGAFTAWKKGRKCDFSGYIEWCETWHRHPAWAWGLIPDVIDGSDADNDALVDEWPKHLRGVPVYHLHEKISRLTRLAERFDMVALGSSGVWSNPGDPGWWSRMAHILDAICDEQGRPMVRLHGLRMLDNKITSRVPLASADSTNAVRNNIRVSRFGMYVPPDDYQRAIVIADRIESHETAHIWERPKQLLMFKR
jgi:hypothetical protein